MTHYKMLDRAPSVLITSNRNELKVYQDNIVYLNNGDNFELRFFNPLKDKIGVEIIFNGIKKGDSFLVLNPGQDITLDRFLDEKRKMLFETYKVDGNNAEAVKAIQDNGLITFNFYREQYNQRFNNPTIDVNINYNFPPEPHNYNYNFNHNVKSKGIFGGSGTLSSTTLGGSFTTLTSSNYNSRSYSPGVFLNETDMSYIADLSESYSTLNNTNGIGNVTTSVTTDLETGRVEKGDISNQTLKTVNLQFAQTPFHSISYKILPYSAMNQGINEVRQYCPACKYRIRKTSWKFCPSCGEDLI